MMRNNYAKAYKEVLEIIKYFPESEYKKIPKEKIDFYKNNLDYDYEFTIDPNIDLSEQNISKEANAIIVTLYENYFATEVEKSKIKEILKLNEIKEEQEKRKKYNPNDLFKNTSKAEKIEYNEQVQNVALVKYKENFFTIFKNFILKLLHLN